jgi:hypothetical protein
MKELKDIKDYESRIKKVLVSEDEIKEAIKKAGIYEKCLVK